MAKKLPSKLLKEPLLEAICELRVDATVDLHNVVPGMLFTKLGGFTNVESTPASTVPVEVRATMPGLQDAPLVRLEWKDYWILCGTSSVAVATKIPYRGWPDFKKNICAVLIAVLDLGVVRSIHRYSLKYVNLLAEEDLQRQIEALDCRIGIGEREVNSGPIQMRCEMLGPQGMVTNLQIATGAVVQVDGTSGSRLGAYVDADTIMVLTTVDIAKFKAELQERLEIIKLENKKWVFESFKQSTIDAMGPTYG